MHKNIYIHQINIQFWTTRDNMDFLTSCLGTSRSETAALKKASASCPSDEEIIRFENELRQEQAAQDPLVSPLMPISVLQETRRHIPN